MSASVHPSRNSLDEPTVLPGLVGVRANQGCRSYGPGHAIHWIQVRLASEADWVPATILDVDGHDLVLAHDADTVRGWNHDPATLRAMADLALLEAEARVRWCPRYHLLLVGVGDRILAAYLGEEASSCLR